MSIIYEVSIKTISGTSHFTASCSIASEESFNSAEDAINKLMGYLKIRHPDCKVKLLIKYND